MLDNRIRMLIQTVNKLYRRGAKSNIQRVLVKTHTADIAEVIENLETGANIEVLRLEPSLDKRAEVLSYLKPEVQKEILYMMEEDEVRDIVNRMESDDAADVLGILPDDFSDKILRLLGAEDSEEVSDLMGYPEDSAGGIMNSEFLRLNQDMTVAEAILAIQNEEEDSRVMFYLYVIDENEHLVGVLSLKQLLLSRPRDVLREIATSEVIKVTVDTDKAEAAKVVERYDFLAIPVVGQQDELLGVITVDDVIDVIREEAEEDLIALGRAGISADVSVMEHIKARTPWLLLTFAGGVLGFVLIQLFSSEILSAVNSLIDDNTAILMVGYKVEQWWYVIAAIPLILSMGATAGNQALSIALGVIRSDRWQSVNVFEHWLKEAKVSLSLSAFFTLFSLTLGTLFIGWSESLIVVSGVLGVQLTLANYLGALIPLGLRRAGVDPTVASIPFYMVLADLLAVVILFGVAAAIIARITAH